MTDDPDRLGTISCVVDAKPRFQAEVLRWYAALNRIAGVASEDLVVHVVNSNEYEHLDYLSSNGVSVRTIEPNDARSPHCNKISGALNLAALEMEGLAVLTDTDVVLLEDPRTLSVPPEGIASRIVYFPAPTLEVFSVIFEEADLELPPLVPLEWRTGEFTVAGNGNGGLYLVPGSVLARLATAWDRWAKWLLERIELFGQDVLRRLDQIAMVMALTSEGLGWAQLDIRWNLPIAIWRADPNFADLAGLHCHRFLNASEEIESIGVPSVDDRIDKVNAAFREVRDEALSPKRSGST